MSDTQAEELALEIERFVDIWASRRMYAPNERAMCRRHLRSIIEIARRAAASAVVEIPHEGPVD